MKRFRSKGGFTLIELLIVIIIIGILAAIAIPLFLNQRDKAKVAAVKEGVHSIQVGVQTAAIDSSADLYPAVAAVAKATMTTYIDNWPDNPFAGGIMVNGTNPGTFWYKTNGAGGTAAGDKFAMCGQGKAAAARWKVGTTAGDSVIFVGDANVAF